MKYRGKIGSRRTDGHLVDDVNIAAIPYLAKPYTDVGPERRQIGGAAPKSLVVIPTYREDATGPFDCAWVAKCPGKHGARECVTEYVIACIGRDLPIRVAGARLIRMPPPPGVACEVRFLSRYFLPTEHHALMHGLEVVARCLNIDPAELRIEVPPNRAQEREFYTIDFLTAVLRETAGSATNASRVFDRFCRMMAFDALVGANDRHPENWGLTYNVLRPERFLFSPIYDTARGLFWNKDDAALAEADAQGGRDELISRYAERSRPLISAETTTSSARQNLNHFEVIEYMVNHPQEPYAAPIRALIMGFEPQRCAKMLHQVFGRLVSRRRLEYIDALLRFRHARLKKICRLP